MTTAIQAIGLIRTRLESILPANGYTTDAGLRITLGQTVFDPGSTLPLLTLIAVDSKIERRDCATHVITDTLIVEGHFAALTGDVLTPGHALLRDIQRALMPANCDFTFGGLFIDLTVDGRRVFPREEGAAIGVCQLRILLRYHDDF